MSNLLRLIHTMKPPKKKKRKEKTLSSGVGTATLPPLDPVLEEKKKQFPGLSLPDDTQRAGHLLQLTVDEKKDLKVANEALGEVSAISASNVS